MNVWQHGWSTSQLGTVERCRASRGKRAGESWIQSCGGSAASVNSGELAICVLYGAWMWWCLAAIQQCADNTGNVDRHICRHRELGACPDSSQATSESWSCLPNPLVDLCVQGEVVSDGGAEVGELADNIEFVVVNANDRRCVSSPRTFVFFRLMVRSKSVLASEKQSINDSSSSWVWVATAASSANSMSLMISLRTFVFVSETGNVEEPVIWAGTKVDAFCCCV